jgi:calcium channel MID1
MTHNNNVSEAFKDEKRNRFAYNRSRNPMIDKDIRPGPYKEMLPCEDLCFDIVRSCPAQLGFSCPNSPARELTYGKRDPTGQQLTCSFPGAVVKLNVQGSASVLSPHLGHAIVATMLVVALGWM